MESQLQLFGFQLENFIVACTFLGDQLRIKIQPSSLVPHFILSQSIDSKNFPDHFRHSPLNSPFKIYSYLQQHKTKKIKLEKQMLVILLEEDEPLKIQMGRYVLDDRILKDHQQRYKNDFLVEKRILNQYKNLHFWDKSTPNAKKYTVNHLNLIKLENGWQQITSLFPLEPKKLHAFKFKIIRFGGDLSIGFGIIKRQRKNALYSGDVNQQGSIGIWSKKKLHASCICSDGDKIHQWDQELFFAEKSVFNIVVDLIELKIVWNNGAKQVETKIKNSFLTSELFMYSVMYDQGSEVELLQQH